MRSVLRRVTSRPWLIAAVVVLVLAIGFGSYWLSRGSSSTKTASAPTEQLVAASTGTIRESVSTTGTVAPADDDSLSFGSSGQVIAVSVSQGDTVKAGQVLGRISSASLQASVAQAKATLANDQAKVAADQADTTTTSAQLSADEAAVTAASGQVTSAQQSLDDATLTSPIAGVVAAVNVTVGQQIGSSGSGGSGATAGSGGSGGNGNSGSSAATSSSSSSSAAFEVISTSSWVVNATVSDTQVGLLAKGDQAQLTDTGATGTVYGTVSSIGVIASSSGGSASYPVVVQVTGSPSGLHAGASATVALIYKQLAGVLTVPSLAVHQVGGKSVVYESSTGKAGGSQVSHAVTTGLTSGGDVQIVSGLSAGDEVYVATVARTGTGSTSRTGTTTRGGFGGAGGGFGGAGAGFGGAGGGGFAGGGTRGGN